MKFEEILKLLREGKKVRRKDWEKKHIDYYWRLIGDHVESYCDGIRISKFTLINYIENIEADDWEEYKEKEWTLKKTFNNGYSEDAIKVLKQKILIDVYEDEKDSLNYVEIRKIIKKRFGF